MNILDDPKKSKMLGELGALAEKIASGRAKEKDVARALQLEAAIPWPQMNIRALSARSAILSEAEAGIARIAKLTKQLKKKAGF